MVAQVSVCQSAAWGPSGDLRGVPCGQVSLESGLFTTFKIQTELNFIIEKVELSRTVNAFYFPIHLA